MVAGRGRSLSRFRVAKAFKEGQRIREMVQEGLGHENEFESSSFSRRPGRGELASECMLAADSQIHCHQASTKSRAPGGTSASP